MQLFSRIVNLLASSQEKLGILFEKQLPFTACRCCFEDLALYSHHAVLERDFNSKKS